MVRFHRTGDIVRQMTAEEEAAADAIKAQIDAKEKLKPIIKEYQTNRKNEYPAIGDQLDMLWHSIDEDASLKSKYFKFHQAILAVKSKYSK